MSAPRRPPRTPLMRGVLASAVAAALLSALLAAAPGAAARPTSRDACAPVTPDGPCGMDLQDAWSRYTTGDPHVLVAYVEGGINWHLDQARQLLPNIYVNWHETPLPCDGPGQCDSSFGATEVEYDVNHDGVVNALDWADDQRVHDANGNGYIDPEDLTVAFSDGTDRDHDGYVDDISGWDFYDRQNDSATYDAAYAHSDDQMEVLQHECPKCMILPVKAGAEALDRTEDLAQAWLFAADAGASVISSVTADLGDSAFMGDAVRYLDRKGVAMVESSNDFDSADHQGGMYWPFVLPGNGVVATHSNAAWTRSDYTSWGTHGVFSVATNVGTTSESTPTTAGVVALLLSYGRLAAQQGIIARPLIGQEAEQILITTAKRVTDPSLPWPGSPGDWNLQYGYGIPNVYHAMQKVAAAQIPPAAQIVAPAWYRPFDPTRVSTVPVTGTIAATRTPGFTWKLEMGLGGQPTSWSTIGTGSGSGSFSGLLGTLDLADIPSSFWSAPFALSKTKELETVDQYTVTLRLKVTDAAGLVARDRRAVAVVHDPTWLGGPPIKLQASGESQPALVDLQRTGRLDVVFGDASGMVHAIDPATRRELPGWPVHTDPVSVLVSHAGVDPGHDPVLADVAVGDLTGSGDPSVVATTLGGSVFAFGPDGHVLSGWPKRLDTHVQPAPIPRPAMPFTRLPVQGAVSGPTLWPLDGGKTLDVVQAGWDGYLHVWKANGTNRSGWPVKVRMPAGFMPDPGYVLVNDQKLDSSPAIAYLHGHLLGASPDIVIRPQYTETRGSGIQPLPFAFVFAYDAKGKPVPGWPVKMPGVIEYYGSAQEFITEGTSSPSVADVSGTALLPDEVAVGPVFSPPYLIAGTGTIVSTYGAAVAFPPKPGGPDVPIAFTTSGAFGKVAGVLGFSQAETGALSLAEALLFPGSGNAINEYDSQFLAAGGLPLPLFPVVRQGIDFLGEPIVADVTGDGLPEVIDGGDSNAMHAWTSTGLLANGFPKWTTGWTVFSPSAGDLLGTGTVDLASVTREGYLFVWRTPGKASANDQWWRAQHDEWNSGNYGAKTRTSG